MDTLRIGFSRFLQHMGSLSHRRDPRPSVQSSARLEDILITWHGEPAQDYYHWYTMAH